MTFTPIPIGSQNWGPPVNAAFTNHENRLSDLMFDVKDPTYGAVGDGVTNDAPAIQAAITAAGNKGTVYIPPGTYLIQSPLSIPPGEGLQIRGSGWGSVLKLGNQVNDYIMKFASADTRITVRDLKLDGNYFQQSTAGGGISGLGAIACRFDNIHFTAMFDEGLLLGPQAGNVFGHNNRVIGCLFDQGAGSTGAGRGIHTTSNDENQIIACDFEFLGGSAANNYSIFDESGTNFIQSCNFVNGANNSKGYRGQNIKSTKIIGCNFDGLAGDAIFIAGQKCLVADNTIFSPGIAGTAGQASGIYLEFASSDNIVTGNAITSAPGAGVSRSAIREDSSGGGGNNTIADNRIITSGSWSVGAVDLNGTGSRYVNNVGGGPAADNLYVTGTSNISGTVNTTGPINAGGTVTATVATGTTPAFSGLTTGNTNPTINLNGNGAIVVGSGTAPADIVLARSGASTWTLQPGNLNIAGTGTLNVAGNTTLSTATMSGALNMGSTNKITNLANGTANTDAPNISQVVLRSTLMANVRDFGAVGNGTTDDSAAIAAAVTSLTAGGVLYFPTGNYLMNSNQAIILNQPISVRGAGPDASTITIGASFTQANVIQINTDNSSVAELTIRGASTTITTNPVAQGVQISGAVGVKVFNTFFRYINGYAIQAVSTATSTTINGGQISNVRVRECAGGIWIKGINNGSGSYPVNYEVSNYWAQLLGVTTGASANLDGFRIEDAWDVLGSNIFTWMNSGGGSTGAAFRVIGNCAATFITNLDALGPQAGAGNVVIQAGANGSPQNVQLTGGVIQQGQAGIVISDAATQVRVDTMRFINNQTHGALVSTSGASISFSRCFFSTSGNGATGTNYDINWTGTGDGFISECRFASPIVATGTAGVQGSINISTNSPVVRVMSANFVGTGANSSNYVTTNPAQMLTHMDAFTTANYQAFGNQDYIFAAGQRLSLRANAAGNNTLAFNVGGVATNDNARILGDGTLTWGPGTATRDTTWGRQGVASVGSPDSGILLGAQGKTLTLTSGGAAATSGTVTANGTTSVVVSTTAVTANSVIVLTFKSGTPPTSQQPYVFALSAGTSFTIRSVASDTNVYNWMLFNFN